jgi:cellulose synthase/poly-beta-1,6-N-acetylglucosamine synthase-like glycosyltransferase
VIQVLFWLSLLLLVYLYIGYPCLIALLARYRPRPVMKGPVDSTISVVTVIYNEAHTIERKLHNLYALDGLDRVVEIVVASDGSTDETIDIVKKTADQYKSDGREDTSAQQRPPLRLRAFPYRRGKPSVLNDVIPACTGELIVLMDARQVLERGAVTALVRNFHDPEVGIVSGELIFRNVATISPVSSGISRYWAYEKWIRKSESTYHSVPGATGALYAIRKSVFVPLEEDTLLDDVAVPMQGILRGWRAVFEPEAVVYDDPARSAGTERVRKRRTIAGNIQLLVRHPLWLLPHRNPIGWQYFSHKILRLYSPFLLLTLFVCGLILARKTLYLGATVLLLLAASSAVTGWWKQKKGLRGQLSGVAFMFASLNVTILQAWFDTLRGAQSVTWSRSQ